MQTTHRILLDLEYLKEAQRLAIENTPAKKLLYKNLWIQWPPRVILTAVSIYFSVYHHWSTAAIAAFIVAVSFLGTFLSRRSQAKARQNNRLKDTILTFALDDEGIDTTNQFSNAHLQWPAIFNAVVYPQGVLLQLTPNGFAWLPDSTLTVGPLPRRAN